MGLYVKVWVLKEGRENPSVTVCATKQLALDIIEKRLDTQGLRTFSLREEFILGSHPGWAPADEPKSYEPA